jgi:hypothetical protein
MTRFYIPRFHPEVAKTYGSIWTQSCANLQILSDGKQNYVIKFRLIYIYIYMSSILFTFPHKIILSSFLGGYGDFWWLGSLRENLCPPSTRAVHFCQNLTILRHSGPASDSERRGGIQRKCQNAKRFVPCLKKYIGKRLRLLTVALDTGSAVAALPCPVWRCIKMNSPVRPLSPLPISLPLWQKGGVTQWS